jgi:hypothetical protein
MLTMLFPKVRTTVNLPAISAGYNKWSLWMLWRALPSLCL